MKKNKTCISRPNLTIYTPNPIRMPQGHQHLPQQLRANEGSHDGRRTVNRGGGRIIDSPRCITRRDVCCRCRDISDGLEKKNQHRVAEKIFPSDLTALISSSDTSSTSKFCVKMHPTGSSASSQVLPAPVGSPRSPGANVPD